MSGRDSANAQDPRRSQAGGRSGSRCRRVRWQSCRPLTHPYHLVLGLAGRCRWAGLGSLQPVPELGGNRGAAEVGRIAVDLYPAHRPETEGGDGEGTGGRGCHATPDVIDVDPVADLQRAHPEPGMEPAAADDRSGGGFTDNELEFLEIVPLQIGAPEERTDRFRGSRILGPGHPRSKVGEAGVDRANQRRCVVRCDPSQMEVPGVQLIWRALIQPGDLLGHGGMLPRPTRQLATRSLDPRPSVSGRRSQGPAGVRGGDTRLGRLHRRRSRR